MIDALDMPALRRSFEYETHAPALATGGVQAIIDQSVGYVDDYGCAFDAWLIRRQARAAQWRRLLAFEEQS